MVILELDGEEAVVVHSKELMQNQKNNQKVLDLGDIDHLPFFRDVDLRKL